MKTKIISLIVALVIATGALAQVETPSQIYGQLFEDVQMQRVFPDNKAFVDAVPNSAPTAIMQRYQEERGAPGFDLAAFVQRNFTRPGPKESTYRSTPGEDVCTHIDNLWRVLERKLRRDLLLGFLLHHAGVGRERPARSRAQYGRELREPHRPLRPYTKWQPKLMPSTTTRGGNQRL